GLVDLRGLVLAEREQAAGQDAARRRPRTSALLQRTTEAGRADLDHVDQHAPALRALPGRDHHPLREALAALRRLLLADGDLDAQATGRVGRRAVGVSLLRELPADTDAAHTLEVRVAALRLVERPPQQG